jgi:hypothetical protein
MFDLFRFMLLRSPEDVEASATIPINGDTPFTNALKNAASQGEAPLEAMKKVAENYILVGDFVDDPGALNYSTLYHAISDRLRQKTAPTLESLKTLIEKALKKAVNDKAFLTDKRRIHDSLVALQLAPAQNTSQGQLVQLGRVVDLIERVGRDDSSLKEPGAIMQSLQRFVVLPPDVFPVSSLPARRSPQPSVDAAKAETAQERQGLLERVAALKETLQVVKTLPSVAQRSHASAAIIRPAPAIGSLEGSAPDASAKAKTSAASAKSVKSTDAPIEPQALHALSSPVKSVLAGLNLDLATTPVADVAERLTTEITTAMDMYFAGGAGGAASHVPDDPFHEPTPPQEWWDGDPDVLAGPPTSHGNVVPTGIADLLVVREHVVRYELGEIAFVENVAKGESFKRQTHRKDTTEDSNLTTTAFGSETVSDVQSTDHFDLQSANRFDLQREASSVVQENTDRVPGVGSTEAYGPLLDVGGSTTQSGSSSSTQSASQAANYGQDITRRAVGKITKSLQTQVLHLTTSEFAEDTEHDFDNSKEKTDQIVVYQWLDKISEAQVFKYDNRVIYDFVVPEPAAFLVNALKKWQPELTQLQKPTLFTLRPDQLSLKATDEHYYQRYAVGYGATGIQPPPEPQITVARTYGNASKTPFGPTPAERSVVEVANEPVPIDPGYQARTAVVQIEAVVWDDLGMNLNVDIGRTFAQISRADQTPLQLTLNREVGQIPVTVLVDGGPEIYTVAIEIICEPTEQSIAQWQAKTHDIILQASRDRLTEYEDRVNNLKAALRVQTAGKTLEQKQELIKAELEKDCISILSNQHFDTLNAIEFSSFSADAVPQLFLPNVEPVGRYIRFFQQAFEWDQMLYRYYPYFWGRKKYWNDRLQLDDEDPQFAAFLDAGAARVTVPVRKGYEGVVATFLTTGVIPSTVQLLGITTGLYVPFFAEVLGGDGGPDTAKPYGDPWPVRVPTKLVKIRTTATLPRWKQFTDPSGRVTYVPDGAGDSVDP